MRACLSALMVVVVLTGARADDLSFNPGRFDEMAALTLASVDFRTMDSDTLAWGMGYVLNGYLEMYGATGQLRYLRLAVRLADAMIEARDDRRGVPDHAGRIQPLWGIGGRFTVAMATLQDEQGRDAVLLRSIRYAHNDSTVVRVEPGADPGTWTLSHSNEHWGERGDQRFENLSLDPASPRYIETVVSQVEFHPDLDFTRDLPEPPSFLLIALDLRGDADPADKSLAPVDGLTLQARRIAFPCYNGPIGAPIARLAAVIRREDIPLGKYRQAADRYVEALGESFAAWDPCWREGPGPGEGHYLMVPKGEPFWTDGIGAPLNYLGAAGQALLHLHDATGRREYLERAVSLGRLFRGQLEADGNDAWVWNYWWGPAEKGWTKEDGLSVFTPADSGGRYVEDVSHGAWSIEFAVMLHRRGLVFTREDMNGFVRTFMHNVRIPGEDRFADRVGGARSSEGTYDLAVGRWAELSEFDPVIFDNLARVYFVRGFHRGAYGALAEVYARLYKWQERLGR